MHRFLDREISGLWQCASIQAILASYTELQEVDNSLEPPSVLPPGAGLSRQALRCMEEAAPALRRLHAGGQHGAHVKPTEMHTCMLRAYASKCSGCLGTHGLLKYPAYSTEQQRTQTV